MTVLRQPSKRAAHRALGIFAALITYTLSVALSTVASAEEARVIPAPTVEERTAAQAPQTIVLAGGCFWGVQGVFQHTKGVINAVSGYAGGDRATAEYAKVSRGWTGHAEAVRITYDPREISSGKILQIFFSVAHDPTQLDRQGPDVGTQYRSAIFPADVEQARIAKAYIAELDKARSFGAAIVTKIEPERAFYAAEDYHQDYMTRNPRQPYIVMHDAPKLVALKRIFPDLYRPEPTLVSAARSSN